MSPTGEVLPMAEPTLNLYQKLARISAELVPITPTGNNQYNKDAVSIEDVENAIREPLAKAGIVTGYTFNEQPTYIPEQKIWLVNLTVWMIDAESDIDRRDHVFDVGSNISAAVSFALKRYYKALFHLGEADDPAEAEVPPQFRANRVVSDDQLDISPNPRTPTVGPKGRQ